MRWHCSFLAVLMSSCMLIACDATFNHAAAADQVGITSVDRPMDRVRRPAGKASVTRLRVSLNKSVIIPVDGTFNEALVGSTDIVDVVPLSNSELYVLGKKLGTTNISVLDREKRLLSLIDVEVGLDTAEIAIKIQAGVGVRGIRVSTRGNKIVLSGTAPDAPTVDRAVGIATELAPEGGGVINTIKVASPQQVMLQVRILEASRQAGREFGLRSEILSRRFQGRLGPMGTREVLNHRVEDPVATGTALSIASSAISGNPQFGHMVANLVNSGSLNIDMFINALETRGLVRRLAEPNLIALSGDSASFLAGGEFPVPTGSTAGAAGVPTIQIEWKEFGVRLSFTPTVLANGAINLRLEPEVSEIDPSISVTTGAVVVPGLSKRRAKTTVELRDGQSFAIAGLLQAISQRDIEQFPWLGSVPVIGTLLRSTAFQQRESELVVIVTPRLVKPAKPGAIVATPLDSTVPSNDIDLFLLGKLERKKTTPVAVQHYITTAGTVAGPHGHILVAPAPIAAPSAVAPVLRPVPAPIVRARN